MILENHLKKFGSPLKPRSRPSERRQSPTDVSRGLTVCNLSELGLHTSTGFYNGSIIHLLYHRCLSSTRPRGSDRHLRVGHTATAVPGLHPSWSGEDCRACEAVRALLAASKDRAHRSRSTERCPAPSTGRAGLRGCLEDAVCRDDSTSVPRDCLRAVRDTAACESPPGRSDSASISASTQIASRRSRPPRQDEQPVAVSILGRHHPRAPPPADQRFVELHGSHTQVDRGTHLSFRSSAVVRYRSSPGPCLRV